MGERVQRLIDLLETPGQRVRTGVILVPAQKLAQAENLAVALNATLEDIAEQLLRSLPSDTRFADLSAQRISSLLDTISNRREGHLRALIYNLDLLLSGVDSPVREQVWHHFLHGMLHRPRILLALMPSEAKSLLPNEASHHQSARVVSWE